MCSGARSSSANGAIAIRQASAAGWSTSSSSVRSDCTTSGPGPSRGAGTTAGLRGLARGMGRVEVAWVDGSLVGSVVGEGSSLGDGSSVGVGVGVAVAVGSGDGRVRQQGR